MNEHEKFLFDLQGFLVVEEALKGANSQDLQRSGHVTDPTLISSGA